MEVHPFIYSPEKSVDILKITGLFLEENPSIKDRISSLGWVYSSLSKTVPQTTYNFFSGHNFPSFESWDELQISFDLASFGLYKQAFASIRSGLELGLLSIYFNINDDGHEIIKDWLRSKQSNEANTPRTDRIWKILLSNTNIARFDARFNLQKRFNDLGYLNNYVHTKGHRYSNRAQRNSNFQTFEKTLFMKWLNAFEEVVNLIVTLHLLKYPIALIKFNWSRKCGIDNPFPVLEIDEVEKIEGFLSFDYMNELREIADSDEATQGLYKHILSLPDMTEDDHEEQLIDFHKSMVEHGEGFIKWEIQQTKIMEQWSDEEKKNTLRRLEIVKKWAIKNNFMKPKFERLSEQGFFKS